MKFGTEVHYCLFSPGGFRIVTGKLVGKWGDYVKIKTTNCDVKEVWAYKDNVSPAAWSEDLLVKTKSEEIYDFVWSMGCENDTQDDSLVDEI